MLGRCISTRQASLIPGLTPDFWKRWNDFEILHGDETTFREMLRVKRTMAANTGVEVQADSVGTGGAVVENWRWTPSTRASHDAQEAAAPVRRPTTRPCWLCRPMQDKTCILASSFFCLIYFSYADHL